MPATKKGDPSSEPRPRADVSDASSNPHRFSEIKDVPSQFGPSQGDLKVDVLETTPTGTEPDNTAGAMKSEGSFNDETANPPVPNTLQRKKSHFEEIVAQHTPRRSVTEMSDLSTASLNDVFGPGRPEILSPRKSNASPGKRCCGGLICGSSDASSEPASHKRAKTFMAAMGDDDSDGYDSFGEEAHDPVRKSTARLMDLALMEGMDNGINQQNTSYSVRSQHSGESTEFDQFYGTIKKKPKIRFGERLRYDDALKFFKYSYDYHDMFLVWCSCSGRIFPWKFILLLLFYNMLWCVLHWSVPVLRITINMSMLGLLNLVVAFLLIFRAQQAFAAYREARNKWEDIIWNCWEAQQMLFAHIKNRSLVQLAGEHFIALAICAKNHLRAAPLQETWKELKQILDKDYCKAIIGHTSTEPMKTKYGEKKTSIAQCLACLFALRRIIEVSLEQADEHKTKIFSLGAHVARLITPRLTQLHVSIAECHRISTTPMPWVYIVHLRFLLMILLILLPPGVFGLFYSNGKRVILYDFTDEPDNVRDIWGTCHLNGATQHDYNASKGVCEEAGFEWKYTMVWPVEGVVLLSFVWMTVVGYAMLGLEEIGNEMQNPLGWHKSDLPLELYVRMIQKQIKRMWTMSYTNYEDINMQQKLEDLCAHRNQEILDKWSRDDPTTADLTKHASQKSKRNDDGEDGGD